MEPPSGPDADESKGWVMTYEELWETYMERRDGGGELPANGMRTRIKKKSVRAIIDDPAPEYVALKHGILKLQKEGKKDEIYRLLEQVAKHHVRPLLFPFPRLKPLERHQDVQETVDLRNSLDPEIIDVDAIAALPTLPAAKANIKCEGPGLAASEPNQANPSVGAHGENRHPTGTEPIGQRQEPANRKDNLNYRKPKGAHPLESGNASSIRFVGYHRQPNQNQGGKSSAATTSHESRSRTQNNAPVANNGPQKDRSVGRQLTIGMQQVATTMQPAQIERSRYVVLPNSTLNKESDNDTDGLTKDMERRLIDLSSVQASNATHWQKIITPIQLAAHYLQEEIHEVALPMDQKLVKQWNPAQTGWKLPIANFRGAMKQKATTDLIAGIYSKVNDSFSEMVPWKVIADAWSSGVAWFYHYWVLHPHLSKRQAYEDAFQLGADKVVTAAKQKKILNSLMETQKENYWSNETKQLLHNTQKVVSKGEDDNGGCLEEYFVYKDELEAQRTLKAFLETMPRFKREQHDDFIVSSRRWLVTQASELERNQFKQFLSIRSENEVAVARKVHQNNNKRKHKYVVENAVKMSYLVISDARKEFWTHASKQNPFQVSFVRAQACFRRNKSLKLESKSKQSCKEYSALKVLRVVWASEQKSYVWAHHRVTGVDLQRELLPDLVIPTLEGVDSKLDGGKLVKLVGAAHSFLNLFTSSVTEARLRKGKLLIEFRQIVERAVEASDEYQLLASKVCMEPCSVCIELVYGPHRCEGCHKEAHKACLTSRDEMGEECPCCSILKGSTSRDPVVRRNSNGKCVGGVAMDEDSGRKRKMTSNHPQAVKKKIAKVSVLEPETTLEQQSCAGGLIALGGANDNTTTCKRKLDLVKSIIEPMTKGEKANLITNIFFETLTQGEQDHLAKHLFERW